NNKIYSKNSLTISTLKRVKFEDAIESITNNGEYIAFIMLNAVAINLSLMLLFMIIKKERS
ncbi:hypothetical protein WCD96_09335, partial [Proteus mirabilis]|uniref:hypothetical protein n=1 Tax=Proteus mirabilis TaxID=584 RepID=UPI00003DC20F